MPQLDVSSFTTQILWLVIVYFTFYILLLKFILPKIGRILKFRESYKIPSKSKIFAAANDNSIKNSTTSQLLNIINSNNKFIETTNAKMDAFAKAETEFYLSSLYLKDQNEVLKNNLESIFIKKQLLEHEIKN